MPAAPARLRAVANRIENADEHETCARTLTTMSDRLRNNAAESRFELDADGHTAFAYYNMAGDVITFRHTEVPAALEGHGIGSRLIRGALEFARAHGLKVVPQCPFVSAYVAKHSEFNDLVR
jgi:hypothetical protein